MSADNTIAILRTKRTRREISPGCWVQDKSHYVWRVAHVQALDNFDWYQKNQLYNLGAYLHQIWGGKDTEIYLDEKEAILAAHRMENEVGYVEYGVTTINTDYIFYSDY